MSRPLLKARVLTALSVVALTVTSGLAWAQSQPTVLVPDSGTQAAPASGGSSIQSAPLPQPTIEQPMQPMPVAPGQAPAPSMPAPQAMQASPPPQTMPAPAAPPSIGADLGPNIWFGSDPAKLMALMPGLPAPVTVPSLRALQLRLLTTNASPQGVSPGSDPLVPFRADRLNAMGFADAALALTGSAAAAPVADPQDAVEQMLAKGDTASACDRVDAQVAQGQATDPFWRKAQIFCQLSRKQTDQAEISLDLLRESKADAATANFIAVAMVAAGDASPKSVRRITTGDPLLIATMQLAHLPLPPSAKVAPPKPVGPAAWVVTARDTTQPIADRIAAAEHAFDAGLIGADEMVAMYQGVPLVPGDPVAGLAASDSPLTRAELYKATASTPLPTNRARLIAAALQRARSRGDYFANAALYAPLAQQIQPSHDLAWFAPEAARLMFVTGNADRGGFWLNIVNTATGNADLARAAPGLRLLAQLARGGNVGMGDPVATWQQTTGASQQQATQIYAIFAGVGQRIGGWSGIAPITQAGSFGAQINTAALTGRRGETVLLTLIALGGDKLAFADPSSFSSGLGGLASVGLKNEARQIAVEAAVLIGL